MRTGQNNEHQHVAKFFSLANGTATHLSARISVKYSPVRQLERSFDVWYGRIDSVLNIWSCTHVCMYVFMCVWKTASYPKNTNIQTRYQKGSNTVLRACTLFPRLPTQVCAENGFQEISDVSISKDLMKTELTNELDKARERLALVSTHALMYSPVYLYMNVIT